MKLAIITGVSRGIGLAAAEKFLSEDFVVAGLSRSLCPNDRVKHFSVDMSQADWTASLPAEFDDLLKEAGQIVLVHNAGLLIADTIETMSVENLQATMQVNVVAPAALNEKVLPSLTAGDSIIYIGSTLSEIAVPGAASYVVSKHAIAGMMRATCQDLRGKEIHTVCVCPGATDTVMLRSRFDDEKSYADFSRGVTAAGRLATPDELADLVFYAAVTPLLNGAVVHGNLGEVH